MQRRNQKSKKKNKLQHKLLPSLTSTAAIPGRRGGISSVARRRHQQTEQLGQVYTSVLDLLKHTTRDPAVLTELNSAEAHDMRQAAAMRNWMSVGSSGMAGSTVVAAALRAAAAAANSLGTAVASCCT